jgi:cytochrome c2
MKMKRLYLVLAICLIAIILIIGTTIVSKQQKQLRSNNLKIDSLQIAIEKLNIKLGRTIFRNDCQTCHAKGKTDDYLEGVVNRVGEPYLKMYLTNQDSLTNARDKYALALKEMWGHLGNNHNFKYTQEELNALIRYLQ